MITWTAEGAVERPVMVQIRVQRAYPGRIQAGAPVPTRSLTQEELRANLQHFTVDLAGPRSRPCTKLVLSGVGVVQRPETPGFLREARELGIENVVLHVGAEDLEGFDPTRFTGLLDAVVVPVQAGRAEALVNAERAIGSCRALGVDVAANAVLSAGALGALEEGVLAIARAGASRVTFSYPFPVQGAPGSKPPPLRESLRALELATEALKPTGVQIGIKGLPGCYLGALSAHIHRSANRWYVDADHQLDQAVLFFPNIVSFTKDDGCRFCDLDARCDGFFARYLAQEGFGPLEPVQD